MANLFWKRGKTTISLLATPFKTEDEFEKTVFETPEILEDIFLIKRQVRHGNKPGIPDIVGIDNDGNVCIVEMKNVAVDASIIPQVLQYAFWAESNPDSIKSLWFECEEKPDDLEISWDEFRVRVIVIAPTILPSTLDIVNKINYQVDLIEVKRWVEDSNELLLVNKLEEEKKKKVSPVKGLGNYDEEFYKKEYNKNSAVEFLKYCDEVEALVKAQGWPLDKKFNKHYCGFKAGFFNAFGVMFIGTKTFAFFFKIPEEQMKGLPVEITKYDKNWKQALVNITPGKTRVKDFLPLFKLAYKRFAG
jgi:hypothetical protein